MSKRTKLKLQNLRVYLKKNVFNGRYMVRNILAVTIMLTFVIAVYGAGSLISENKKNGEALDTKTADSEIQEEIIAIDVKSTRCRK